MSFSMSALVIRPTTLPLLNTRTALLSLMSIVTYDIGVLSETIGYDSPITLDTGMSFICSIV